MARAQLDLVEFPGQGLDCVSLLSRGPLCTFIGPHCSFSSFLGLLVFVHHRQQYKQLWVLRTLFR
jgi:hypothetical protein